MTFYVETNETDGRKPVFRYKLDGTGLKNYWQAIPDRDYMRWGNYEGAMEYELRTARQEEKELCQSLGQKWQSFRGRWMSKKMKQLCKPELD